MAETSLTAKQLIICFSAFHSYRSMKVLFHSSFSEGLPQWYSHPMSRGGGGGFEGPSRNILRDIDLEICMFFSSLCC